MLYRNRENIRDRGELEEFERIAIKLAVGEFTAAQLILPFDKAGSDRLPQTQARMRSANAASSQGSATPSACAWRATAVAQDEQQTRTGS